jgi:hypothetical protein
MIEKKSINFLPEYFKSAKNDKFLSNTLDQFLSNPELERIDGYVGSKLIPNYNPVDDTYISESIPIRKVNQLSPAGVFRNEKGEIEHVVSFNDLIGTLIAEEAYTNDEESLPNIDRLFDTNSYTFNPKIVWDMLVNYDQYYWLPDGPDPIVVNTFTNIYNLIVGMPSYTMPNGYAFSNGMKVTFPIELSSGSNIIFSNTEYIVEGVGIGIILVPFLSLVPNQNLCTIFNEMFDNTDFDTISFDSDKPLPLIHDYITINRASRDLNPWSRYNRWFHSEIIRLTSVINKTELKYDFKNRAKRPIIEFNADIKLFNFGENGINNIDLLDNSTEYPFVNIQGSIGYYIDGVLVSAGIRVIFNNSYDKFIRNRVYKVNINSGTNQISLVEDVSSRAKNSDSISVNEGIFYGGKSLYYDAEFQIWKLSQQHFKHNQPPLFDIFDDNGKSYSEQDNKNNFNGTKIFGYALGDGIVDEILGFSIKQNGNFIGIGSYQFTNYFDIETFTSIENQQTKIKKVSSGYLKRANRLENVWNNTKFYTSFVPITQEIFVTENTTTLEMTLLYPFEPTFATPFHSAVVNGVTVNTKNQIIDNKLIFTFANTVTRGSYVGLKYRGFPASIKFPFNPNLYYSMPVGLASNPLNDIVSNLTLAQLTDNVSSMLEMQRFDKFVGQFPGSSNLRDLPNIEIEPSKILQHEHPIAFALIFLGNAKHNVIDAIRFVSNEYTQFKQKFLNSIAKLSYQNNVVELVDEVLDEINQNFKPSDLFYRSDMIAFGKNKKVRKISVTSLSNVQFPLGMAFNLNYLSYTSVLVYRNKVQQLHHCNYEFDTDNDSVKFITPLVVGDIIELHVYQNTLGCYIPSTPSKLGIYPKYEPKIFLDDRYAGSPVKMIQGHDGSLTKAFYDFRDDALLELEKRIYNNIKVFYNYINAVESGVNNGKVSINSLKRRIIPGSQYRYTHEQLLAREFYKWLYKNNLSLKNTSYNDLDWKTYNFKNSQLINNPPDFQPFNPSGTWRFFYAHYFNTDRPNTHPWEILGFSVKPNWWEKYYGAPPYTSLNVTLWDDISVGRIREGEYEGSYRFFRISNITSYCPVDEFGNLRNPQEFGILGENTLNDKKSDWEFGDYSPVEVTWRNSSEFPFANTIAVILLSPAKMIGPYFDTSRIRRNIVQQLIYTEDNLYLDPRKMLIEGYNTEQTAGLINFITEYGKNKNPNYLKILHDDLKYFDMNLFYPLGGFTSKDKLKIKINAVDPDSTSPGLFLPPEDYNLILYTGAPIRLARISGIIIEITGNKFILKGYDRSYPWFTIYKPIITNSSPNLTIGGKEETYVTWQPYYGDANNGLNSIDITNTSAKFYRQGQIVYHNQFYYRVSISHSATRTFDDSYFIRLPSLPTFGGVKVLIPTSYERQVTRINYGNEYSDIQEVFNIILGYGNWLEEQGFVFDEYNQELNETLDWLYSGKEFLFWTTHKWAEGNVITISPFADKLKFSYPYGIVKEINVYDKYFLLKADGQNLPIENIDIIRTKEVTILSTKNTEDGLFFAVLEIIQKEHGIVLNNTTIFNDTIFEPASGYKQERIKLIGFRTKFWNGDIVSPGFVFDNVKVVDWEPFRRYYPSQVVQFRGKYYSANLLIVNEKNFDFAKYTQLDNKPQKKLITNFEYRINQFDDFYSLDIDNFDIEQQQLAKHLVGFSSRNYLDKLIPDETAQYKFFQGFIKEKGIKKSIDKIVKYNKSILTGIELKEEWAFRIGTFGIGKTFKELEFVLEEAIEIENPFIVTLSSTNTTSSVIHYITKNEILIEPEEFVIDKAFTTIDGTYDTNNLKLLHAGYVRIDDVTATAYNKNSLLDIANNSLIQEGNTVWLGFKENGDWDVYRYSKKICKIKGVFVSGPGQEITFVTDISHNLQIGDIISVTRFSTQVDGVYIVKSIPKNTHFIVSSTLVGIVNEVLQYYGSIFVFQSVRFTNADALAENRELIFYDEGTKIWIDNDIDKKWMVLNKTNNYYSPKEYTFGNIPVYQSLGSAMYISKHTKTVLISSPNYFPQRFFNVQYGNVKVGTIDVNEDLKFYFDYSLNLNSGLDYVYCQPNVPTEFGHSLAYDIGKDLFIAGAPRATKVRASNTATVLAPLANNTFTARTYINEGLVKVSTRNVSNTKENTKFVLAQVFGPNLDNTRFGQSVYVNQVAKTTATTLLVGAPTGIGSGTVFAYKINPDLSITAFNTSAIQSINLITQPVSSSSIVYVRIAGPNQVGGSSATAVAVKVGLTVTNIIVTNRGSGYSYPPIISFTATSFVTIGVATATIGFVKLVGTSSITLNQQAEFGAKIAGDFAGLNLAVGAKKQNFDNGYLGVIQIFDQNLYWKQTLYSPFKKNENFGHDIEVSSSGKFLIASSINASTDYNTYGRIAVYKKNESDAYELSQFIDNPLENTDLIFGQDISINESEDILAVSSLGTNRSLSVRFFQNIKQFRGETIFDNNETTFITKVEDAGAVYTFNRFGDKFIQAQELLAKSMVIGSQYGKAIAVSDKNILVGAPFNNSIFTSIDKSRFFQFKRIDNKSLSWKKFRYQDNLVDTDNFQKLSLINKENLEVVEYLDIVDPLKGKIIGLAEQELRYKAIVDPAIYSIGIDGLSVDTNKNWLDDQVGFLWWDLSTTKFVWYEQGDEIFRKNNWGKLFPGASIDVYEWVKSSYLPNEWASLADTNQGLTRGISGQPKFPDNSVISVKQVFNSVTGVFENVYYYWVKNKSVLPNIRTRKISAAQVAQLISDPIGNDTKFAQILSKNSIALANIQGLLSGSDIGLNVQFDSNPNDLNHTEWILLSENDSTSMPTELLNKKLIDSLLGRDEIGNKVPDRTLNARNRYGLSIRPRQTIFRNRFEALRNLFDYVNNLLAGIPITGNYNFENLIKLDPIPVESSGEYDFIVDDLDQLQEVEFTEFIAATATCVINNGKIVSVAVTNRGKGYKFPPKIEIIANKEHTAIIKSVINDKGQIIGTIIENSGNNFESNPKIFIRPHAAIVTSDINSNQRWALYYFNYNFNIWNKQKTQLYNTPMYWDYKDYKSSLFQELKSVNYIVNNVFELNSLSNLLVGDYIKVTNVGDGRLVILEYIGPVGGNFDLNYNLVFAERGTLQFKSALYDINQGRYAYDSLTLDETLFDQLPDFELKNILNALKNDIFTDELKIYWNKFFFQAVKYAFTEQKHIDWAFKTSFVNVKASIAELDQYSAFRVDSSQYIEEYIKEIKPYHTKIRNFLSGYEKLDLAELNVTDFDLPAYYNYNNQRFESVEIPTAINGLNLTTETSILLNKFPYTYWFSNYRYYVKEVVISDGGAGYNQRPNVVFSYENSAETRSPAAQAYIRNGQVFKIVVTDPGANIIGNFGNNESIHVDLVGGGSVSKLAKASVILANDTTRKNVIAIKFDRYSKNSELGNKIVTYTTITDGYSTSFELPFLANNDKTTIIPTLNKKLIYQTSYDILNFADNTKINKNKSSFVFKNIIPQKNSELKIIFEKNINLFNAIDRIENYYVPNGNMPGKNLKLLMYGMEYPGNLIQTLGFAYSTPLLDSTATNLNIFDNGEGFNNFVDYYSKNKLIHGIDRNSTSLVMSSVLGIVPGQTLNYLHVSNLTSGPVFRTDTIVQSVITAQNRVILSSPNYTIRSAVSTSTAVGSQIRIETKSPFFGTLRIGDVLEISGIETSQFNQINTITNIESNSSFFILSNQILPFTISTCTNTSSFRVYSILQPISVNNNVLDSFDFNVGECIIPDLKIYTSATIITESYTATFIVTGDNVNFGLGRTFGYAIIPLDPVNAVIPQEFESGLNIQISNSVTSLPLSFNITTLDNVNLSVGTYKPFRVNLYSYITSATVNINPVASVDLYLTSLPITNPGYQAATYKMDLKDYLGNKMTQVSEGDIVYAVVTATTASNVVFGAYGRVFRLAVTGTNITQNDIIYSQISPDIIVEKPDDFPITFRVQMFEDYTTEGLEELFLNLGTFLLYTENSFASYVATKSIYILDTSITGEFTYQLFSTATTIYEGTTTTIFLKTINLPVGTQIPWTLTSVVGSLNYNDILINDAPTLSLTGTFTLVDGAPDYIGYQIGYVKLGALVDVSSEGYESFETWRLSLINLPYYIDINVRDSIVANYGNKNLWSYAYAANKAFTRVKITTTGNFEFDISPFGSTPSVKPVSAAEIYSLNPVGLGNLFVRATIEPTDSLWQGNIKITGPGIATAITATDVLTNGFNPIKGSWVTILTAASYVNVNGEAGWYAEGSFNTDTNSVAIGGFNLIIDISTSSEGPIVVSGLYRCRVSSIGTII